MKTRTIKSLMIIGIICVMSSSLLAATIYPSFNFNYRDASTGYTYTIGYAIYNTDLWNTGGLPIGNSSTYAPNPPSPWPFTSPTTVYVLEPTPLPMRPYRILVGVERSDGEKRYGWSDYTDLAGLTNGTLTINVDVF